MKVAIGIILVVMGSGGAITGIFRIAKDIVDVCSDEIRNSDNVFLIYCSLIMLSVGLCLTYPQFVAFYRTLFLS